METVFQSESTSYMALGYLSEVEVLGKILPHDSSTWLAIGDDWGLTLLKTNIILDLNVFIKDERMLFH